MNKDLDKAVAFHREGQLLKAENIYLEILENDKGNFQILQLLGTLYLQKNNFKLSEEYFLDSLKKDPENPFALNNLGLLKKSTKDFKKSIEYFELNIKKNNFLNSWVNKSNILLEYEKYNEGLKFSKEALKIFPKNLKIRNNLAIFLFNCGFQEEALKIYKEFDHQKLHFKESYINYSNLLIVINNLSKALEVINEFILEDKNNLEALRQRALINKLLSNFDKSEEDLLKLIQIDKLNIISNQMIVKFYIDRKNYEEAIKYCDLMLIKKKDNNFFFSKKILCKIYLGNWIGLKDELKIFNKDLEYNQSSIDPLSLKYVNDDPLFQKKMTEIYWNEKPKNKYLSKIASDNNQTTNNSKIKIGYLSGDFKNHAVFYLVQDLFVNHNKKDFEIYAYSTVNKNGPEREKIINNTNKFFDINNFSDEEIIKLIKSHDLDIAIDLSGYTDYNKSHLFEYNIAKIKINYLGFPGTMGTSKYDYILADKNIILSDHFKYYSEKVIYMPDIYQPFTPINFEITNKKSEFGLPDNKFVIGCFSRIEKILPNIFDIWMKILKKYNDVYLALCIDKEIIKTNIKNYCHQNNFDFKKIIFLNFIEHSENLRRISTFDLYLDTFPYNGHTGISDSLFQCCVPTISLTGKSFASRVSLSLLDYAELKKLVTYNEKDYFEMIDYYCLNRNDLKTIKKSLVKFKNSNLNRMVKFTKDFEKILTSIFLNHKQIK
jgi:predicted O-linked N-acetylglucosamine transferase (SPINDLY family)